MHLFLLVLLFSSIHPFNLKFKTKLPTNIREGRSLSPLSTTYVASYQVCYIHVTFFVGSSSCPLQSVLSSLSSISLLISKQ